MNYLKKRFNDAVKLGKGINSANSRAERLRKYPVRTLVRAFIRRMFYLLINVGILPEVLRVKTFWGEKIYLPARYAFPIIEKGYLEGGDMILTHYLLSTLKEGDVFLDGGANYGWYSILASELVGEEGAVHSFEPTERFFRILQKNLKGLPNATCNEVALWREAGQMTFNDFGSKMDVANTLIDDPKKIDYYEKLFLKNPKFTKKIVRTITLDEYCRAADIVPTFIKLDCEGAEFDILSGAERTLSDVRPILAIEIVSDKRLRRSRDSQKIFDLLRGHSYNAYGLTKDGALVPVELEGQEEELENIIFKV